MTDPGSLRVMVTDGTDYLIHINAIHVIIVTILIRIINVAQMCRKVEAHAQFVVMRKQLTDKQVFEFLLYLILDLN